MSLASTPTQGSSPFFLDWLFDDQFNSSSRTLSETIGKLIWLMWGAGKLSEAVFTDNTTKFAYWCGLLLHNYHNNKMRPCVTFSGMKGNFLIRLHSSTFVFARLVTRLHSSTLVYIRLHSSVTSLHSSTLSTLV